jgi:trigger factor
VQVLNLQRESSKVEFTVVANSSDLDPIKSHVLSHFVKSTKVPGFRAGNAPINLVEKHVNYRELTDEFLNHALNDLYIKALDKEKIRASSQPEVNVKKFVPFSALEFEVKVESFGKIEVGNYKNLKVTKPVVSVTTRDINEVIETLRKRSAERTEVNRPAKKGDEVIVDFEGSDKDSKPVNGASTQNYPLILGDGSFIPGFEDALIGIKAGGSKTFDVTFPDDYQVVTLQGQKVTFKVDAKTVNELKLPALDADFAKKVGPFESVAELKSDIKKQLTLERSQQSLRQYEDMIVRQISDSSKVDVPPSLVEEQLVSMEEEEKRNLAYKGQTWDEHLKFEGVTEEEHRDRHRKTAEERVKAGLVLSEISEVENINVTPEDINERISQLKLQYQDPQMQIQLEKPEMRSDIASRIITEKTVAKLVKYASK